MVKFLDVALRVLGDGVTSRISYGSLIQRDVVCSVYTRGKWEYHGYAFVIDENRMKNRESSPRRRMIPKHRSWCRSAD